MTRRNDVLNATNYEFGRLLYQARRSARTVYGAEAMGTQLGVSTDTVQRWEAGTKLPRIDELASYIHVLRRHGVREEVILEIRERASNLIMITKTVNKSSRTLRHGAGVNTALDEAMNLPEDAFRIANSYLLDQIPQTIRNQIEHWVQNDLESREWRLDRGERGDGCTCPALNKRLVVNPPSMPLQKLTGRWAAYDASETLRIFSLVEAKKKPGDLFNHAKIRVASDISLENRSFISVQETDYISSVMSDQIAWCRVWKKGSKSDQIEADNILWDGVSAFIDMPQGGTGGRLKGLGESMISNQLGASTIAFSADGHLMIVGQNDKNRQSVNFLAPTGSGSLDWSDVENSKAEDLLPMVRYGAERELREEAALNGDESGRRSIDSRVMVIGFARMLHRGGKPEFFCFGLIDAPSAEIVGRDPERYVESVFPSGLEAADWEHGSPSGEIVRVCESYLNDKFGRQSINRVPLSYPLEHGLKLLVELCRDDDAGVVINRFVMDWLKYVRTKGHLKMRKGI